MTAAGPWFEIVNDALAEPNGVSPTDSLPGSMRVVVQRTDWFYALKRRDNGEVTYSWDEYWIDHTEAPLPIEKGVAKYNLTMGGSGTWRVRFLHGEGDEECRHHRMVSRRSSDLRIASWASRTA